MHKRVLVVLSVLMVLVIALTLGLYFTSAKSSDSEKQEQLIEFNEIGKLLEEGNTEKASGKLEKLSDEVRGQTSESERDVRILIVGGCAAVCILIAGIFIYVSILRPLRKISKYTTEIARGNTDIPLTYDRGSEVGEFSWAFDSMRRELNKARASEKEAIENNKTVIATLSHDIKTPITSIRAYAEGLEANLDSSPEKRAQYLQILMKKCDEVSKVTDDLLLHSLSDMHRLQVEKKKSRSVLLPKERSKTSTRTVRKSIFRNPNLQPWSAPIPTDFSSASRTSSPTRGNMRVGKSTCISQETPKRSASVSETTARASRTRICRSSSTSFIAAITTAHSPAPVSAFIS